MPHIRCIIVAAPMSALGAVALLTGGSSPAHEAGRGATAHATPSAMITLAPALRARSGWADRAAFLATAGEAGPWPATAAPGTTLEPAAAPTPTFPPRPVPADPTHSWRMAIERDARILELLPHLGRDNLYKLGHYCPADFNKDDAVDAADLALFLRTWRDESSPIFHWCDLNGDGFVDGADAAEFMRRLGGPPCDAERLARLREQIC